MGTKHDILTEDELSTFAVTPNVLQELMSYQQRQQLDPGDINVLDWGCGRGRSVAKLRELGFRAYGVEIDRTTLENGFELFRSRELDPADLLRHFEEISSFPAGFFHFVFSEQVFEHVADLEAVAREMARVTHSDGCGVHTFPSARCILEEHLSMPCVHWLPKNRLRYLAIRLMVALGKGPQPDWVEVSGRDAAVRARFYFDYSREKTFYRDIRHIEDIFRAAGFEPTATLSRPAGRLNRLLVPSFLARNGFPDRDTMLTVQRNSSTDI